MHRAVWLRGGITIYGRLKGPGDLNTFARSFLAHTDGDPIAP
jgi:hypothetical protein